MYRYLALTAFLLGFCTTAALAQNVELPNSGIDKTTVENRFGRPETIRGPVGDPPITRWLYSDFTVVFEYDRVIHAFRRDPTIEQYTGENAPARPETGDTLDLSN